MSDTIIKNIENGVMSITFNRPGRFNAFNREMAISVQEALNEAMRNEAVRAVFITATGKAFCSGQDLKETEDPTAIDLRATVRGNYNPIIEKMRKIEKPVLVAVNGVAAGAGANIALAGDVVVAAKSATFIQAFSKIGLIPDCGGTYFLPRAVGWGKASGLMMMADNITADDAERIGMIYKVIPDEDFEAESKRMAQYLADMPTKAFAYTKLALNQSAANDLERQLNLEVDYQGACGDTEDFAEGVTAFVEKRKPDFRGR
ncbi:MAG: enoyl-CoA hydratase/isomerase family protein [Taibaiella sp.]|nr:enoyl-CoA hydratase/isomerase family protein [Taibaiella sp.]